MTTAAIPIDYRKRKRLWIDASLWLASNERPTIASSIWNLGYAERILLELEAEIANLASDHSMKEKARLAVDGMFSALRALDPRAIRGPANTQTDRHAPI
jgi:hypothetical protein